MEVKIAIIVAAIMITFCIVIFIVKKSQEPDYNNVEMFIKLMRKIINIMSVELLLMM